MNTSEIDAHLDATTILHLSWKPGIARDIAAVIVNSLLHNRTMWPDQIDLSFVPESACNVIGTQWRRLKNCGIIVQTGQFKRSMKKESSGRVIWQYKLACEKRARTFMDRNGITTDWTPGQQELAI